MLAAERLEVVKKERKLPDNLSHSTPAHQKKFKTRHYLVILFQVSFIFRVFNWGWFSGSKTDRADFIARSFFIRFGVADRRFTVDDGAPDVEK